MKNIDWNDIEYQLNSLKDVHIEEETNTLYINTLKDIIHFFIDHKIFFESSTNATLEFNSTVNSPDLPSSYDQDSQNTLYLRPYSLFDFLKRVPFKNQITLLTFPVSRDVLNLLSIKEQLSLLYLPLKEDSIQIEMPWLVWACYTNQLCLVKFLVTICEASINACTITYFEQDVVQDNKETIQIIKPLCIFGEWTPLMLAAANDHITVVVFLLHHQANVDTRDSYGYTALYHALLCGSLRSILMLLKYGASLFNIDGRGLSLYDVAEKKMRWDYYQLGQYFSSLRQMSLNNKDLKEITQKNQSTAFLQTQTSTKTVSLHIKEKNHFSFFYLLYSIYLNVASNEYDWNEILLPVVTFLCFLCVTLSFYLEVSSLMDSNQWIWSYCRQILQHIFPCLWISLFYLFKLPSLQTTKTTNYILGHTALEKFIQAFENPTNEQYLNDICRHHNSSSKLISTSKDSPEQNNLVQIFDMQRLCYTCFSIQSLRTFHCRYCQQCIRGFDHHCFWLRRCIGDSNHQIFFLFVTFLLIIEIVYPSVYLSMLINRKIFFTFQFKLTLMSACVQLFSLYWIAKLFYTQLYNILFNFTTYEQLRGNRYEHFYKKQNVWNAETQQYTEKRLWNNPFDKGIVSNCFAFWGRQGRQDSLPFTLVKTRVSDDFMKTLVTKQNKTCCKILKNFFCHCLL